MKKMIIVTTALLSSTAFAHSGHIPDNSVHSLLHIEHVIALTAIVVVAFVVKKISK